MINPLTIHSVLADLNLHCPYTEPILFYFIYSFFFIMLSPKYQIFYKIQSQKRRDLMLYAPSHANLSNKITFLFFLFPSVFSFFLLLFFSPSVFPFSFCLFLFPFSFCRGELLHCIVKRAFLIYSQIFVQSRKHITISQKTPGFSVCKLSLLKTPWEKEKLLVTSNSSFSHSVFYPCGLLPAIFIKFKSVVCRIFQLGRV